MSPVVGYADLPDGRRAVRLTHVDVPGGTRMPVSAARLTRGTTPPAPPLYDPTGRVGIYHGGPAYDQQVYDTFGTWPGLSTTYVQPEFGGWNLAQEQQRLARGTSPLLTWTTKYTQWIADIASGGLRE